MLEPRTLTVALGPEGRAVASVAGTFVIVVQGNQIPGKGFGEKSTRSMQPTWDRLQVRMAQNRWMSHRPDLYVRRISACVKDRSEHPQSSYFRMTWFPDGVSRGFAEEMAL